MAQAAYKVFDRRSSQGYVNSYASRSNFLHTAATQTNDRKNINPLDRDVHRNVTSYGRRTLMSLGRNLFANYPVVCGALLEQANLSVGTFIPQYYGANKAWGNKAEALLYEWHQIMDAEGPPFDYEAFTTGLVLSTLRDGDEATLLTENADGYPLIQTIPAHRIGCREGEHIVVGGQYDGARIIDGVIVDDVGRPIAYRVLGEDQFNTGVYTDIPANNIFLTYSPVWRLQKRGFSGLAAAIFPLQDVRESKDFELIAQKACAAHTIIETNELGEPTPGSFITGAAQFDSSGSKVADAVQSIGGGMYRYMKAGTGSKIDTLDYNRPGMNVQQFQEMQVRDCFCGMEWDYWFSVDPTKIGSGAMRIVVERINATICKRRRMVGKACKRVHGYAVSKFIKLGLLAPDPDWWKWEYQGDAEITADRKYESEIDLEENARGWLTDKKAAAKRGEYYEDVRAQKKLETAAKWQDAQDISQQFGITIQEAYDSLYKPNPNPPPAKPEPTAKPAQVD